MSKALRLSRRLSAIATYLRLEGKLIDDEGDDTNEIESASAELRRLHAVEQERDELKAEVENLGRWKSTHAPRIEALEGLLAHYQTQAAAGQEAATTLASEREANAILTDELEKLRAYAGQLKPIHAFLLGEGEIDGYSFGDAHQTMIGKYWWRLFLRAAIRLDES